MRLTKCPSCGSRTFVETLQYGLKKKEYCSTCQLMWEKTNNIGEE
jgi:hypothetical protein